MILLDRFLRSRSAIPKVTVAVIAAALLVGGCLYDDVTPVAARYRTAVEGVLARYHVSGALVSVSVPGDDTWKQAFGYANLESRAPFDPASFGSIRSITKSFTVTVILQLVRDQVGDGYGAPTKACRQAIRLAARSEGLLLDPVYSGKALAGLAAMAAPVSPVPTRLDARSVGTPTGRAWKIRPGGILLRPRDSCAWGAAGTRFSSVESRSPRCERNSL